MRELLFKARRIDNGEWVLFKTMCQLFKDNEELFALGVVPLGMKFDFFDFIDVNPETVCQYIGVEHSEHGKIFEGDVFRDSYGIFVMSFEDDLGSCGCCWDSFEGVGFAGKYLKSKHDDYYTMSMFDRGIKFIGNIHDDGFDIEKVEL